MIPTQTMRCFTKSFSGIFPCTLSALITPAKATAPVPCISFINQKTRRGRETGEGGKRGKEDIKEINRNRRKIKSNK